MGIECTKVHLSIQLYYLQYSFIGCNTGGDSYIASFVHICKFSQSFSVGEWRWVVAIIMQE